MELDYRQLANKLAQDRADFEKYQKQQLDELR